MSITLEGVAMRTFRFAAILLSILAASVLPAVPAAHAQSAVGVTADTIKIGTFGALTGPGYLYGKIIMNGAETVYNEVNKAGGIHGRKIVLVREDDRCDPAAARPEIEKGNLPFVVFASVADEVTVPTHPQIFSTALSASIESASQLEFALKQGA